MNYFEMRKGSFVLDYKYLPEELLDACIEHVHYNNEQPTIKPNIFVNYITKDTSILNLKLGNGNRHNHFPTFTLSKHTPHHHSWPITSGWLLRWNFLTFSLC